jgi:hypothetical protein
MIAYPHESGVSEIDDPVGVYDAVLFCDESPGWVEPTPEGCVANGVPCAIEPAPDTLRSPPPTGCNDANASFDIECWSGLAPFTGLEFGY